MFDLTGFSSCFFFCALSPDYQRVVDPKPSRQTNRAVDFKKAGPVGLDQLSRRTEWCGSSKETKEIN